MKLTKSFAFVDLSFLYWYLREKLEAFLLHSMENGLVIDGVLAQDINQSSSFWHIREVPTITLTNLSPMGTYSILVQSVWLAYPLCLDVMIYPPGCFHLMFYLLYIKTLFIALVEKFHYMGEREWDSCCCCCCCWD